MSLLSMFGIKAKHNPEKKTGEKALNPLLEVPEDDPTTSMSEIVVRALIPITRENWPHVQRLSKKKIWMADDEDLDSILEKFDPKASGAYVRCDDPARPFVVNGNKARIQLWTRRDMPVDADHMVMIQSDVLQANGKVISFMPQIVIRGKDAPFIMIYRMSCCGKASYSVLTSIGDKSNKNFSATLDSNPTGIKAGMGSGVFFNPATNTYKVRAANPLDSHIMETMYKLIGEQKRASVTPTASPR